jgi:uncharacterized OB-fold protein
MAQPKRPPAVQQAAPPYRALRGHPLSDAEFRTGVVTTAWTPTLEYAWDAGEAISRFLEGLRQEKILGVRCRRCGRTVTPPRAFCELDFKPMDEWVELAATGTVNTFSICYVTWDMKSLRRPQIPAVIEIDGTSPRVGFLHLVGGVAGRAVEEIRRRVRVGMPVRAVWKPSAEREGAITDIRYFEPIASRRSR